MAHYYWVRLHGSSGEYSFMITVCNKGEQEENDTLRMKFGRSPTTSFFNTICMLEQMMIRDLSVLFMKEISRFISSRVEAKTARIYKLEKLRE